MPNKYLGIEIGGTKLQLAVGSGATRELAAVVRDEVDVNAGAAGILRKIEELGKTLCSQHDVTSIGVGFGGPVDTNSGRTVKSHQIQGWDNFPLGDRLHASLGCPVHIENDCNAAAMGEAAHGAGKDAARVFYVTVGTGVGGGFVVNGQLDGQHRPAISEIGHLRPSINAVSATQTVEAVASGWGIAGWTRRQIEHTNSDTPARELLALCDGEIESLSARQIGAASVQGNAIAEAAMQRATQTLGWAIAQAITLVSPDTIIVGGGVSLSGDSFFVPLRKHTATYVFPALLDSYRIVPAALGEEVVLHGAIQVAQRAGDER